MTDLMICIPGVGVSFIFHSSVDSIWSISRNIPFLETFDRGQELILHD